MSSKRTKFPTPDDVLAFLAAGGGGPVTTRTLAHHFNIRGANPRIRFKSLLQDMTADGLLAKTGAKSWALPGVQANPDTARAPTAEPTAKTDTPVIDVRAEGLTEDGELFALPTDQNLIGVYPRIILDREANLKPGDIATVALHEVAPGDYEGRVVTKQQPEEPTAIMGLLRQTQQGGWVVLPLEKKLAGVEFLINSPLPEGAKDGAVVLGRPGPRPRRGPTPIKVIEIVADELKGQEAAIAIRNFDLPHVFPDHVLKAAKKLTAVTKADLEGREDLRSLPIITIDGVDAKDFDDAVWAEPWNPNDRQEADIGMRNSDFEERGAQKGCASDEKLNLSPKSGFHIIVAIADVAHYVRSGSELDEEAIKRGNSVYFPNMVIPMLPEKLSNDLCSLRPHEDRPVVAVHMWIDDQGKLMKQKFVRAVIHSAARTTYEQVQAALDGNPDETTKPVLETTIKPLFAAYQSLLKARQRRGALDLDVPEKLIVFGQENGMTTDDIFAIERRDRLDSHRLIEELMILANVAAATALETKGAPCLYRIHPEPGKEKLDGLKSTLQGFGVKANLGETVTPARIQGLIDKIRHREESEALMQVILRSQEQARYDPDNVGHFGLGLQRYAHFTSPIRRYSDLVVHRQLIETFKLAGKGGEASVRTQLQAIGEHLNQTERAAQKAEWNVRDRLTVRYYTDFVGKDFTAHVITITSFGMFVAVDNGVAEGLLPLRLMNDDHYIFDEKTSTLTGKRTKKSYRVGNKIEVTLLEADQLTGRLTFGPKGANSTQGRRRPRRSTSPQRTGRGRGTKTENSSQRTSANTTARPPRRRR